MPVEGCASTVYVTCRWSTPARSFLTQCRGVVVGEFIVTIGEVTTKPEDDVQVCPMPGGERLLVHDRPRPLGGDPRVWVCHRRVDGSQFVDADELRVRPYFQDAYSGLSVLGVDPREERGMLWAMRHGGMRVRTKPLREGETVLVARHERPPVRAIARSYPGPLAELAYETNPETDHGDCGSPIMDENGELVGVVQAALNEERVGVVAELCKALPGWIVQRICG